jgi:probable rRNA maturation factor
MIELEIADSASVDPALLQRAHLERAAQETLRHTSTDPDSGLTLLISDDAQLRQLNRQFLEIDEPTDVLSFPAGHLDPDTNTPYLGDIILSYPRAAEQATAAGHSLEQELRLLVVHGVLHLVGYDHAEPEDQAEMWKAQDQILNIFRET